MVEDVSSRSDEVEAWAPGPGPIEPGRRVFVNRNLRFGDIDWVGFDMDYTLAPYAKRKLEALSFAMTRTRLVERMGYPEPVLELPYDPDFVARGLVIDKRLGNTLKVDRHGHVGRAYHGRTSLARDARREAYRNVKVNLSAARYHWVDTLFALPEASLYADLVDLYDGPLAPEKSSAKRSLYPRLFEDVREAIDACHRDGSLKARLVQDLPRYVIRDPELPDTLHKLRASDKKLFVLTNSEWSYTEAVLHYLLDGARPDYPRWTDYFDLVICEAGKPRFFTEAVPFEAVEPRSGARRPADSLVAGGVYAGGSTRELARQLPELHGENVLYVGDHIYGDIIRSKKDTLWRTALVIEELEEEMVLQHRLAPSRAELEALEDRAFALEDDLRGVRAQLEAAEARPADAAALEELRDRLARRSRSTKAVDEARSRLTRRIDRSFNRFWGSVFREGHEQSRFGWQVEAYACIYTSRVSNLLAYSTAQYFRAPRHWMPHEKAR